MADKSLIEKLDLVLSFLAGKKNTDLNEITAIPEFNNDREEVIRVITKLIDDKLVLHYNSSFNYIISIDGYLFYKRDGYRGDLRRKAISDRNEYIRTLLLAYGTALAGAYGLFEMLKYIFPILWHLIFC